jgi:hypothetical protein
MNSFYVDIPESLGSKWSDSPLPAVQYSCGGSGLYPVDRMVRKGGNTVIKGDPVAGGYRLMVKCGHNAEFDDLRDCKGLAVFFDTGFLQNTTMGDFP